MNAKMRETAKGKSNSKTRGGKLRATLRRKRVADVRVGKGLPARAATLARSRKAESKRNVAFAIAAAMVALLTVYLLMQPAVALNGGSQSSASSSQTEEAASLVSVGADDAASASQEGGSVGQQAEESAGQHADGAGVDDVGSGGTDAGDASVGGANAGDVDAGGAGDAGANDANAGDADADDAHEGGASAGGEEDPTAQPTDQAVAAQSADGASAQSADLNVNSLGGKSFAIVNQASGSNRALTALSDTVNNVDGLVSQAVSMHDGKVIDGEDPVTLWTFEKPTDGSGSTGANQYYISTLQEGENKKYLRLCDVSYDNSNDGRGSLGVGDAPQLIAVTLAGNGKVTLSAAGSGGGGNSSYVNLDSFTSIFWSFSGSGDYSQHLLCKVINPSQIDYSGTWAIVNTAKNVAMLAEGLGGNETANRAGEQVYVRHSSDDKPYVKSGSLTQWTFTKQTDGTYFVSTIADGVTKYLQIGDAQNKPVTLSETPQGITVTMGGTDSVRLTNGNGMAVNLYGSDANRGFGSWDGDNADEYFTLCKVEPITTVQGVSHPSSVINLFDYWITEQGAADYEKPYDASHFKQGINADHALKFVCERALGDNSSTDGKWNVWQGSAQGAYQGIVASKLENGYPKLSGNTSVFDPDVSNLKNVESGASISESLAYLFNPDSSESAYRETHRNVSGLLQVDEKGYYYYDSSKNYAEYDKDKNSFTLYDDWGVRTGGSSPNGQFFPFDSFDEVKDLKSTDSSVNHYFGMTLTTRFVQQYGGHVNSSRNTETVFNFAGDDDVWIFIDDVLVADLGGIHDRAGVSINFATGEVSIKKTKSSGSLELEEEAKKSSTLKELFKKAGESVDGSGWNGDTFADNTTHTLKFYYLERGNTDSNLWLQYNLTEIPETAIYKVDQYGDVIEGAGFAVYRTNSEWKYLVDEGALKGNYVSLDDYDYNIDAATGDIILTSKGGDTEQGRIKPRYTGTTDKRGEMVFVDEDQMPYSLDELKDEFGDYFALREVSVPQGYRMVSDEVRLFISSGVLLCDNSYESGVYASPTELVTATDNIYLYKPYGNTQEVKYYESDTKMTNGTMFAVVMKYVGEGREAESFRDANSWAPIYGNATDGYTVVDVKKYKSITDAIASTTLQALEYGDSTFSMSASGSLQANLDNLPGDIMSYYFMLDQAWDSLSDAEKTDYDNNKEKYLAKNTLYTVAFYWTPVQDIGNKSWASQLTADNLYRVQSEGGEVEIDGGKLPFYSFGRVFGASINVPNLSNRLFVQKFDEAGNLVNGAKFAMYEVEEANDGGIGKIYYVAAGVNSEKVLIFLHPDDGSQATDDGTAGNNKGAAYVKDSPNPPGTYEVDPDTGVIRVSIGNDIYTITPKSYASGRGAVAETLAAGEDRNPSGENGTATFVNMDDGCYYVREVAAPNGYAINPTEVMVLVDSTAVYANAGTADDGVTVARGPGYVVSTLDMIVTDGQVNNTLSWVYERMLVSGVSTSFEDVYTVPLGNDGNPAESLGSTSWLYLKGNYATGVPLVGGGRDGLTANASEALETHLKYSAVDREDKLFNFVVNDEYYKEHSDEGTGHTRRLYTNVGWSYYLLYQDTNFGRGHKAEGAAYDESLDGKEISNLFSRSTYVQITDETLPIDVTIEKVSSTGNNGENAKLSGAKFALYREVGSETKRLYYYASGDNVQWVTLGASGDFTLDNVTLTTNEDGRISFEGLEAGTYYLEEVAAPDGYKKLAGSITLAVSASGVAVTAPDFVAFGRGLVTKNFAVDSDSATRVVTVTIMNSPDYELPQTGGSGVSGFMIAGALLVVLALVGGFSLIRRRAEGGRCAMNFQ